MKTFNKVYKPYPVLLLLLFIASTILTAQNNPENLADSMINIASRYPDSTIRTSQKLITDITEENKQVKGLSYYALGESYYYKQEYDSALTAYQKALNYFIATHDTTNLSSTYNNIGLLHYFKASYGKALDAYLISLNLDKKTNNLKGVAKSHQNIGLIYSKWGRHEQELEHLNTALKIYIQLNDTNSVANMENNIGVAYAKKDDYREAVKHYKKALTSFKSLNNRFGEASALLNIANIFIYQKKPNLAIEYLKHSIKIFKEINNKRGLTHAYSAMGEAYALNGDKEKAIQYYLKSEKINNQLGLREVREKNLEFLHNAYKSLGDYKNANRVFEEVMALKYSIFNEEKFKILAGLEKKYNIEKSEQEALLYKAKSEKQRVLLIGIISFFLMLIILFMIIHKNRLLKYKQHELMLKQKVLRTQMNPHFIFNTLSAIQCLVFENKTTEAHDYLAEFAKLIRKVLEYSREDRITLKQEKELLQDYFDLQNRRFNNKVKFNIISDASISGEKTLIPPMLTQPFIENAIEHGQLDKISDGVITLSLHKKDNKLFFMIEDNGIGISHTKADPRKKDHKSMAIEITRERLKIINNSKKSGFINLSTVDLADEHKHGTRIEFFIPFEEMN